MKTVFAAFAIIVWSAPAFAQSPADMHKSLVLLQEQVDRLQSTHNAQIGSGNLATYLDIAMIIPDPVIGTSVSVWGWALQCGSQEPIAQVAIDGILADNVFPAHLRRPDVVAVYGPYCASLGGVRADTGIAFEVDLSHYASGPHTVQLRIHDARGAMGWSNIVTVTK